MLVRVRLPSERGEGGRRRAARRHWPLASHQPLPKPVKTEYLALYVALSLLHRVSLAFTATVHVASSLLVATSLHASVLFLLHRTCSRFLYTVAVSLRVRDAASSQRSRYLSARLKPLFFSTSRYFSSSSARMRFTHISSDIAAGSPGMAASRVASQVHSSAIPMASNAHATLDLLSMEYR